MLYLQQGKNRILIRITSFILIQIFLLTNLGLSESLYNRNISSSYIDTKGLRVPVGVTWDRIGSAQSQVSDISAESILSSLKEIQAQIAEYTKAGAITEEEQRVQYAYIGTAEKLLSANITMLNAGDRIKKQYLSFIIKDWAEKVNEVTAHAPDYYVAYV